MIWCAVICRTETGASPHLAANHQSALRQKKTKKTTYDFHLFAVEFAQSDLRLEGLGLLMTCRLLSLCKRCVRIPTRPLCWSPHPSPAAHHPLPTGSHNSSAAFSTLRKITVLFHSKTPISCGWLTSTGCRSKIAMGV